MLNDLSLSAMQVTLRTMYRDASRASEEDLFSRLNERTNDLERLQESYVDIGDRCNDLQDEVAELREQVTALQAALATRAKFASSVASPSSSAEPLPAAISAPMERAVREAPSSSAVAKSSAKQVEGSSGKSGSKAASSYSVAVVSPTASKHAASYSTAAYKDDFEEYEDEYEDDN